VIARPIDFLGVNYYTRVHIANAPEQRWPAIRTVPREGEHTDMGWEVYPQGLTDLLLRLHSEYGAPPLYVTENGAAYPDEVRSGGVADDERTAYLERHVAAVHAAIERGADVRGYFAWSLLDNFEWARGYTKRFGLIYVDYPTQARIPKRSAAWYAGLIAGQRATEPVEHA
jgi:beta-glucosidase